MGRIYPLSGVIPIGHVGENESREVALDIMQLRRQWPELTPALIARRPNERDVYMGITRLDGDVLYWTITNSDTAIPGNGEMRIYMTDGNGTALGKSRVVVTRIGEGIRGEMCGKVPVAIEPWVEQVLGEVDSVKQGYVKIEQGAENAGLALVVGEDGRVRPGEGLDESALFDALNRWGVINSLRDGDGAYLTDADGAVLTY